VIASTLESRRVAPPRSSPSRTPAGTDSGEVPPCTCETAEDCAIRSLPACFDQPDSYPTCLNRGPRILSIDCSGNGTCAGTSRRTGIGGGCRRKVEKWPGLRKAAVSGSSDQLMCPSDRLRTACPAAPAPGTRVAGSTFMARASRAGLARKDQKVLDRAATVADTRAAWAEWSCYAPPYPTLRATHSAPVRKGHGHPCAHASQLGTEPTPARGSCGRALAHRGTSSADPAREILESAA
jgi:hypothetical protein